jgi:hypothetical protein
VADMLSGIQTEWLTYEAAMAQANQNRVNDYMRQQLGGLFRR